MNVLTPSTPSMMKASTIEQARVVSVDPDRWTMVVRTTTHGKTIGDVPILSIYLHQSNGEGIHYMPEPGCIVYIARPSDADAACIPLLFGGAADGKASYRANRSSMNPGDISLHTRDDNGIRIKRGGTTEVSSSPLAKTVYTYYNNAVTNIAENFHVKSLGSNIEVETDLPEENDQGKFGSRITLRSREFVDTSEDVVTLSLGRVNPVDPVQDAVEVYKLSVTDKYDLGIKKDGDLVSSYNNSVYNYNSTEHNYTSATYNFQTNTDFSGPTMNFGCNAAINFNTPIATFSTAATVTGLLTVGGGLALSGGIVPGTPGTPVAVAASSQSTTAPVMKFDSTAQEALALMATACAAAATAANIVAPGSFTPDQITALGTFAASVTAGTQTSSTLEVD